MPGGERELRPALKAGAARPNRAALFMSPALKRVDTSNHPPTGRIAAQIRGKQLTGQAPGLSPSGYTVLGPESVTVRPKRGTKGEGVAQVTDEMAAVRAKRKKKVSPFRSSPYKEDYVRLIKAGWSSVSLERYAAYRYDEKIPASTFRNHMSRIEKPETPGVTGKDGVKFVEPEIDVMQIRQGMISLQLQRLSVDANHEFQMNKLFNSTRGELQVLSQLLNEAKQDQKDFGVIAHDPAHDLPDVPGEQEGQHAPKYKTLGQMLGLDAGQDQTAVAERLAQIIPITPQKPATDVETG